MENENLLSEEELMEREERCRKSIKTVGKAVFMRLFVSGLLIWVALQTGMELWAIGMLAVVLIINLSGLLPLCMELKKKHRELKEIIAQYP